MSMHKIPLSPLEEEGLTKHKLPIGTPSQLSDAFRLGMAFMQGVWPRDDLKKFLNVAAGEGYVFDGVDAADLFMKLFPEGPTRN